MKRSQPESGSRSTDALNLEFAAEMATAAETYRDHPRLTERERQIWGAYLDLDGNWKAVAKVCRCGEDTLSAVIQRVKALMVDPENARIDEMGDDEDVVVDTPPDGDSPQEVRFRDIEDSLDLAAKTAHRVIRHVAAKSVITGAELKLHESATRTLMLIRRNELEYLRAAGTGTNPVSLRDLHAMAASAKVE
ncbi:MAG: hypothetical protein M3Q00_00645 [Pseudomonadota bacterium]|nr:hypothetical protein [Pseudomonadota bacterium]